jgi:hypothetical protein
MARSIFILVVILWTGALGCYTQIAQDVHSSDAEQGDDWGKEYIARVYRVEGPDVVRPDGSFELRVFSDAVCPNSFVRFEVAWEKDEASVAVIGVRPTRTRFCPQDAQPPEGELLTMTPPSYPSVEVVFNAGMEYEIRRIVDLIDRRPN